MGIEYTRKPRRRKPTKPRYAEEAGECRRCGLPISKGERIAPPRLEFSHVACWRRKATTISRVAPTRFIQGDHVGEDCAGCGMSIGADDAIITLLTVPWHKECRVVHARL